MIVTCSNSGQDRAQGKKKKVGNRVLLKCGISKKADSVYFLVRVVFIVLSLVALATAKRQERDIILPYLDPVRTPA